MTIGNRIAQLRKAKGYTQEYIAEQLGVSRQAVSKWEQDITSPDTKNLIALTKLLETDISFLAMGSARSYDTEAEIRRLKATVKTNTSIGYMLINIGVVLICFAFIFHMISLTAGLILIVVGIVCLYNAFRLQKTIPKDPVKDPPQPRIPPWTCYTCGEENEGRVQFCIYCQTNKAWSEQKQLEKKEKM